MTRALHHHRCILSWNGVLMFQQMRWLLAGWGTRAVPVQQRAAQDAAEPTMQQSHRSAAATACVSYSLA